MRYLTHQKKKEVLRMKKILLSSVLLSSLFFSTNYSQVSANEIQNNSQESTEIQLPTNLSSIDFNTQDEYSAIDENGDTIIFENQEDYDFYIKYENPNKIMSRDYSTGTTWKTTITNSTNKNKLWVGYHSGTTNWAKASSYTLTKNKTYSVSGSYNYSGTTMNTGFSYSKGISTTIPADSKKYSKLGIWGDFTFRTIKTTEYKNGKPTGNVKTRKDKIRHDYYIQPNYQ